MMSVRPTVVFAAALLGAALVSPAFAADQAPAAAPPAPAQQQKPDAPPAATPPAQQQNQQAQQAPAEPQPVYIDEIGKDGRLRTNVRVEIVRSPPSIDTVLSGMKKVAMLATSAILMLLASGLFGAAVAGVVLLVRRRRELRAEA
ncbi:hypothetical protein [Solimonas marina]|uniref:Uncharacterized protein n=1 Tax=Solimonas marina TaxID=2714601 RepID=A0A970B8K3_9GAMM|nr:hypothetical protein [Solimonas marina]NKF21471.1 hypothetical protein [Solimonas marina]